MSERQALLYVEVDVPVCSLSYGVAPCTAVLGVDSDQRCFNTRASCAKLANYTETTTTLRFSVDTGYNPADIIANPVLLSVDTSPGRISLGSDLGQRTSVTCTFEDQKHSDAGPGLDPYLSTRTYNPYEQGTYWPRFRARYPYLQGRPLRVIRGFVGQTLEEMETRHYVAESFDGPGMDGKYKLVAKDLLKLLDGDRAQAPVLSSGYLSADITSSATTATLLPSGIGNEEYPASGKLAIGSSEIVSFTRSGDTLTLTARGQNGTEAAAHSANDSVQLCLVYTAQDPADIISDLMQTYASVDPGYIPLADWQNETDAYVGQVYTATIAQPTSVKTLVAELAEQAGLAIWADDLSATIKLQALRQINAAAKLFDDASDKIDGTLSITEQPDQRASQIWVYFAQINPLEAADDESNFRQRARVIDADMEEAYGTGNSAIRKVYSRWIQAGGLTIATRIGERLLGRYRVAPRKFGFDVFRREGAEAPTLAQGVQLEAYPLQQADGSPDTVPIQFTRLTALEDRWTVEAEEARFTELGDYDPTVKTITYTSTDTSRNMRDDHDALYGAPAAGDTINFVVNTGVVLGSISTSIPALQTGDWSDTTVSVSATRTSGNATLTSIADTSAFDVGMAVTGTGIQNDSRVVSKTSDTVTLDKTASASGTSSLTLWTVIINLVVNGQVIGSGGGGGGGAYGDNVPGYPGYAGGTGLRLTAPVDLSGAGKIDGGGGGGGGGGGDQNIWGNHDNGGGGGGGAGYIAGNGGYSIAAGPGSAGSLDAGGAGGWGTHEFSGGGGGAPGAAGNAGGGNSYAPGGAGGAAGKSVEGDNYLKDSAFNVQANVWIEVRHRTPGFPLVVPLYAQPDGSVTDEWPEGTVDNPFFCATGEFFYCVGVGGYFRERFTKAGLDKTEDWAYAGTAQAADVDAYRNAGFTWSPESATGTPPNVGCIRLDDADVSLAEHVYLSKDTLSGSDATTWIESLNEADWLLLSTGDGQEFGWPVLSITDHTSWFDIEVDQGSYVGPAGPVSVGDSGFITVAQQRAGRASGSTVYKTDAGGVTVGASVRTLILNKASASTTAVTLPTVASRPNDLPLTIVDFKGNAADIVITPDGSETIETYANWTVGAGGGPKAA